MINQVRWRTSIQSFAVIGLLAVITSCGSSDSENETTSRKNTGTSPGRPNVILIMADDMGWGDTGYNGSSIAETPNLNSMAVAGVRLNHFYAAAPVCSPTRGSVLTGRHPYRYGIYFANVGHLPIEEITLAEVLQDAGYRTGFFGKWHLGTLTRDILDANRGGRQEHTAEFSPPWMHGFEVVFATESKVPTYDPMIKPKGIDRETWWDAVAANEEREPFGTHFWNEQGEIVNENLEGDDSRVIVDRVIPFITEAVEDDVPFFAVIWAHAPHLPVIAAPEDGAAIVSECPYVSHYFGSIRALDRQIGRVRDELQRLGVSGETLVWFTSDNGPEHQYGNAPGSSGGLRGAKRSLYEGGIRVPSVIEWPGQIEAGRELDVPAVTSDIFPTILDYLELGGANVQELDGVTLRRLISGETKQRSQGVGFESNSQIAFVGDRYKLIHQPMEPASDPSLQGAGVLPGQNRGEQLFYEVYDLQNDPYEKTDLSGEKIDKLNELRAELERWRESVASSIDYYEDLRKRNDQAPHQSAEK